DMSNRAADYFFQNISAANATPGPESDEFVDQDRRTGTKTLMTMPLIGWTPNNIDRACAFSIAKYGPQQQVEQWNPDCGNGVRTDGTRITGNDPRDTSLAIGPAFVQAWIEHMIGKYGTAATGGVLFYNLDNEPMLWSDTHRDVHLEPLSYDELRDRTIEYAAAIKEADPSAQTLGPAEWGWTGYFWSALDWEEGGDWWNHPQDRLAHGNIPLVEWYLQQLRAYEQQTGTRLLDYLDLHIYPQGSGIFSANAGDNNTQALRLRSTRQLWDPTYVDESWINEPVQLIPRMKEWVADNYPGTKLAIGEYSWGAMGHISGALAQADVLGIFGREGMDLATLWGPPEATQPGAFAFRMYLNYDGAGSTFGETSVRASSADQEKLAIYAAQRSSDDSLTLMIINKSTTSLTSTVSITGLTEAAPAQVYRYSAANLSAIAPQPEQAVSPTGFSALFPPSSITLVVIPAEGLELPEKLYLPMTRR
ncbi:MAG: glycoside hydrolase family 44 protein, partial [Ardenticatenales bacterium]|nr:glycoside hydrolase family 44 protein [Ardenticatenales bacterium]